MRNSYHNLGGFLILTLTFSTSCHGLFGGVFSDASDIQKAGNQIYIDASDWGCWYYVDFDNIGADYDSYPVPLAAGSSPGDSTCIVTNIYDVFGRGLSVYEKVSSYCTAPQPEPERWHLAIHRDNVRTNHGAAIETPFSSISDLPEDVSDLMSGNWEPDAYDTHSVWVVQDNMVNGYVGCQSIAINYVLSSWLRFDIPPIPPSFAYNGHVFLLRLQDGRIVALRLANYESAVGVKCCMTIEYEFL